MLNQRLRLLKRNGVSLNHDNSTMERIKAVTDLSIIIVNWNSTAYLTRCVETIYSHTHEISFEIIVVDNASPDGDVEMVKTRFPDIILIQSSVNLGFARANNLASQVSGSKYVVFLNPDTLLANSAFDFLLRQVASLPSVGAVGCTLLNKDRSVQTSAIQTFPTILNQLLDVDVLRNRFPACRLWNSAPLYACSADPIPVEVISGACIMIERGVFAQIGQFSEEYFMYAEDLDLCRKAVQAGLTNYYIPQGQIIHYGGASSVPRRAVVMKWKSILLYVAKHRGYSYQLAFRIAMAGCALARLAVVSLWVAALIGTNRRDIANGAFLKWWLVLKTMITGSERNAPVECLTVNRAPER